MDYTLLSKREPIEVELFEDYLIFAQMLGIANKVQKADCNFKLFQIEFIMGKIKRKIIRKL